jgi:hypothetical protein
MKQICEKKIKKIRNCIIEKMVRSEYNGQWDVETFLYIPI